MNSLIGDIAEVAVWDSVLTANDFAAMARGRLPWGIEPANLVAYYPLWGAHDPEPSFRRGLGDLGFEGLPSRAVVSIRHAAGPFIS